MTHTRRDFLAGAAATIRSVPIGLPAVAEEREKTTPQTILALFKSLPGDVAVKIYAPAANGKPEFLVESNSAKTMFVGSAIKTCAFAAVASRALSLVKDKMST